MGKETEKERRFSVDVDRLLAGAEVEFDENTNEDYRMSVKFTRKLIGLPLDPSPQYKEQLKGRLLLELAKQEAESQQKERGNWFWQGLRGLIPQSAVWRTAATTAVVVVLVMVVLWRTGTFLQSPVLTTVGVEMAVAEEAMEEPGALADVPEMAVSALGRGGGVPEAETLSEPLLEIEPNQTQTANGLSITLERVELYAERVVFSAFLTPAEPPIFARYIVDGAVKDAGRADIQYLDEGIRLVWGQHQPYLDPVPSDARDLVFIIGYDWPVPWEFSVPLQD